MSPIINGSSAIHKGKDGFLIGYKGYYELLDTLFIYSTWPQDLAAFNLHPFIQAFHFLLISFVFVGDIAKFRLLPVERVNPF